MAEKENRTLTDATEAEAVTPEVESPIKKYSKVRIRPGAVPRNGVKPKGADYVDLHTVTAAPVKGYATIGDLGKFALKDLYLIAE